MTQAMLIEGGGAWSPVCLSIVQSSGRTMKWGVTKQTHSSFGSVSDPGICRSQELMQGCCTRGKCTAETLWSWSAPFSK